MKKLFVVVLVLVAMMTAVSAIAEDFVDCEVYVTPVLINDDGTYSCSGYIGDHWVITCMAEKVETTEGTIRITCDGFTVTDRVIDFANDDDYDWYCDMYDFIENHLEGVEFIDLGA